MKHAEELDELRSLLQWFGWKRDDSSMIESRDGALQSETWFPPEAVSTVIPGISLMWKRRDGGFWYWSTLDFEGSDLTDTGAEKLQEYLSLRQPEVAARGTR
jgi:hypothetical protein